MKTLSAIVFAYLVVNSALSGSETLDHARQLSKSGDSLGAKNLLAQAAQNNPNDIASLTEYAEFLDSYGDPAARGAYEKALAALGGKGDPARRAGVARRLITLDLLAGDNVAAHRHLEAYQAAGGAGLTLGVAAQAKDDKQTVTIPGPLRSFGRMSAISSDLLPDEVLAALARNVVTNGYQASHSNDALEQTEYLKLVHRYLS
jgi:hypothetical protein